MVDTRELYQLFAAELGLHEYELQNQVAFDRVYTLEKKIEEARLAGRITRYVGRDANGKVFGYAYKLADVRHFLRSQPGLRAGWKRDRSI